jgi:DNA-binding MarR family transcriptional regulator
MEIMKKVPLNDNEQKVLQTLARKGVMSPSQVSAETWILPGETLTTLHVLADAGLVLMRDDPDSVDGQLVALTAQAREVLGTSPFTQSSYVKR